MGFHGALIVAIATVFATEWQLSAGYVGFAKVPVEDGKCQHNGTEITPGEPFKAEFPCEEWVCSSEGDLSITGCGLVAPGPGCRLVKGNGVHPDCCDQLACH